METTTSLGSFTTTQLAGALTMEIVNTSATAAAAFAFTPFGGTQVLAVSGTRTIPPLGIMHERLMTGCGGVSAIALATGAPVVVFTPGVLNG